MNEHISPAVIEAVKAGKPITILGRPYAPKVDPDKLARALHDADCGCDVYDEDEDPRYIEAVRAALAKATT